jgi:hypothetical protein
MTQSNPDAERLIALLSGRAVAAETFDAADWQRIVEAAQKQSVAPMLYARLKERGITPSPMAVQRLREIYLASIKRNTRLLHEVGNILSAFQAADIPVIPLKGACLAEAVYGNLALRQIGDVDLLVKPADLTKALDVLRTLGYAAKHSFEIESERQESQHMPQLSKRGGVTLEIHWTIVNPRNKVHFDESDLDQVWLRAAPAKIGGVQVLMLSPMDLLWHLCLHASVQHRFDCIGLRSFWDMALVIRRYGDDRGHLGEIDWERFARRVNQWGIANGVYLALQLAEEWTGVVIPSPVLAALHTAPLDDATMDWVKHKILNGSSLALKSDVARFEGKARFADKFTALRHSLFPSRTVMASKYHAPANSWRILCYYPVRFKDLWTRYSQAMWQLLRRDRTLTTEARQEAHLREYLGWN